MSEIRARYNVTIERDDDGLPTRLAYSPSTPVYPDVAIQSNEPVAAAYLTTYAQPSGRSSIAPDGEVHYSFNYKEQHVELDVFPDGHLEWFYCNRETEELWGYDVPSERAAAAARDASLIAYVDDLLDLLQEVGGMSAAWCETKLQEYEALLKGQ